MDGVQLSCPAQARTWPELTELCIKYEKRPNHLLSFHDLPEIFETLPNLRSLKLKNAVGWLKSTNGTFAENVSRLSKNPTTPLRAHTTMPKLRKLSVDVLDNESLLELLKRLNLSPKCSINLEVDRETAVLLITETLAHEDIVVASPRGKPSQFRSAVPHSAGSTPRPTK